MADFRFFNIGKANAEIVRLEAELTKAQAEGKAASENLTEITAAAESNAAKLVQAEADLTAAKASIASITAEKIRAEAELKEANEKLANPTAQVVQIAARKAQEITAGQGQPPVTATPAGAPGSGDVVAQYRAITDSTEKIVFYRKHKAAIDAGWSAQPKAE